MSVSFEVIWDYSAESALSTYVLVVESWAPTGSKTFEIRFEPISRVVDICTLFYKKAATSLPFALISTWLALSFVDTRVLPLPSSIALIGNMPTMASSNCYLRIESLGYVPADRLINLLLCMFKLPLIWLVFYPFSSISTLAVNFSLSLFPYTLDIVFFVSVKFIWTMKSYMSVTQLPGLTKKVKRELK